METETILYVDIFGKGYNEAELSQILVYKLRGKHSLQKPNFTRIQIVHTNMIHSEAQQYLFNIIKYKVFFIIYR